MEYSGADKNTPSLFSLMCDSGKFSPHIHPDEVAAVLIPCQENGRRNAITCKDKDIDEFILDVDSLDMNTANLKGIDFPMEKRIPVIPKRFFNLSANLIKNRIVAVTVGDIFLGRPVWLYDGRYRVSKKLRFNQEILRSPIFDGKEVILLFNERDVLLEYLWENREWLALFNSISKIGFAAVTTPNFSVFKGECPTGHAWNIKKGLACGVELEKRGVSVIPHIYSVHQAQIERWTAWLNKHPSVKIITMNCQLQRRSRAGKDIVTSSLAYLLEGTGVKILLHGADKEILDKIRRFNDRVYVASSGIFKRMEIIEPSRLSNFNLPQQSERLPALHIQKML
jgi:hypothetical protein